MRTILSALTALGICLSVAACATIQGQPAAGGNTSPLAALQQFTVADLSAALDDATAHKDEVAARCWMTLLPIVQAGVPQGPSIKGLASAIQAKRDLMGQGGDDQVAALRKQVTLGCSALFIEENRELLKLGVSAFPGGGALGGLLR